MRSRGSASVDYNWLTGASFRIEFVSLVSARLGVSSQACRRTFFRLDHLRSPSILVFHRLAVVEWLLSLPGVSNLGSYAHLLSTVLSCAEQLRQSQDKTTGIALPRPSRTHSPTTSNGSGDTRRCGDHHGRSHNESSGRPCTLFEEEAGHPLRS